MALTNEQLIDLYTSMLKARRMDETVVKGLQDGKVVSFYHSVQGSEAVGVGVTSFLRPDDYLYPHHRGHGIGYIIGKGASVKSWLAEHYGKTTGMAGGIAGFHGVDPEHGIFGGGGTIGSQFPVSMGWGLACKKNGRGQVSVCAFGDGSSNRGTLHEAMNLAAVWKLPVIWVCENNLYAQWMPIRDAYPRDDIADLAAGYNMPGVVVDGQDVIAVHEAMQAAVDRARTGDGPSLLECKTYRYRSHSEGGADTVHADTRPAEEVEAWKKRDPIDLFRAKLLEQNVLSAEDVDRIGAEVDAWVEEVEQFAMDSPVPGPETLQPALYAD